MLNGVRDHTVINIAGENTEMKSLEKRIDETRWLLHPKAGNSSCCIFRVPQCLMELNMHTFQPRILSIGPYHHGGKHLEMMQQHKWRYLHDLLARTPLIWLDDYREVVASSEQEIRDCYSETIHLCSRDLVDLMVLDGIFIIELFRKVGEVSDSDPDDPFFNLAWLFSNLTLDLLLLENQIPYFVLQNLFEKSKTLRDNDSTLAMLALEFFNHKLQRPEEVLSLQGANNVNAKHLLDLVRSNFDPEPENQPREIPESTQFVQSAQKLRLAGIKFKTRKANSFLEIRFRNGVLEIPHIVLDDLLTDIIHNFVVYEQCHSHLPKNVTSYAAFMNCLIRTPADASLLCDSNIIDNYLGNEEEVAHFFKNLGKYALPQINVSYLRNLFHDVDDYHRNVWHVRWAGFVFKYFDTPWSFLSALAAVIILLLTAVQAFFAVYAYDHGKN